MVKILFFIHIYWKNPVMKFNELIQITLLKNILLKTSPKTINKKCSMESLKFHKRIFGFCLSKPQNIAKWTSIPSLWHLFARNFYYISYRFSNLYWNRRNHKFMSFWKCRVTPTTRWNPIEVSPRKKSQKFISWKDSFTRKSALEMVLMFIWRHIAVLKNKNGK